MADLVPTKRQQRLAKEMQAKRDMARDLNQLIREDKEGKKPEEPDKK